MCGTPGVLPNDLRNSMCCAMLLDSNRSSLVYIYIYIYTSVLPSISIDDEFSDIDVSSPLQKVWISFVDCGFSPSGVLLPLQEVWIGSVDSNILAQQAGQSSWERRFGAAGRAKEASRGAGNGVGQLGTKLALERHLGRQLGHLGP